ncbi:MAG TPA: cytidylate kinase-like family protein [Gaiellaceae bacterium]
MACSVVCISHATGAGGDDVGRRVAERLGFLYIDEEIVARAAAAGGVEPRDVADEERRKSLASRILDALSAGSGETIVLSGSVPLTSGEPDSAEIRALIRETIVQTAGRGRVVISAHAASHAIDRRRGVLRVLVTASDVTRVRRVGEAEGIDQPRADRLIRKEDEARRDYLKRFYDVDRELPTQYDLVVNTDLLSLEDAASIVTEAAKR